MMGTHSLDPAAPRAAHPALRAGGLSAPAPRDPAGAPPLLRRIAAGDVAAVREVVAEFGGLVHALARQWSPDDAEVERAVEAIFLDLWREAAHSDPARMSERRFVDSLARRRLARMGHPSHGAAKRLGEAR